MNIRPLDIAGVLLIEPVRVRDTRGWFRETYSQARLDALGLPVFVQDNESCSLSAGTVRGLHYQLGRAAQAKLVRCVAGAVFDVAVDIRPGSPTFGSHVSARLDAEGGVQMFIPEGFAHGFCTLTPDTIVQYKVSAPYAPGSEAGIAWDDAGLGINWPVEEANAVLSDRDRALPPLSRARLEL